MEDFKSKFGNKLKGDPTNDARALGKLLNEAQRVKLILSANTETIAQV